MNKKRILYLLDDPKKDRHVHKYVLDGLVEEGFSPTIGYFYGNSNKSVMTNKSIDAFSLGLKKSQFKGISIRAILQLRQLILENDFRLIHAQRHRPFIHALFATYGMKDIGLFYTVRATNVLRSLKRRLPFMIFSKKITKIICVSRGVSEYVQSSLPLFPKEKLAIVYNGVDLSKFDLQIPKREARRFLKIPEKGFYFGIVARLKKAKCHDVLICAFKELLCHYPDTSLVIVGDGPLYEKLKTLVDNLKISDKVFFTGRIDYDKVPLALRGLDCFVHPSFREGLGVAVLEAMASRLPIIISDADGLKNIFYPYEDISPKEEIGQMVRAKDVQSLAKALISYRKLPQDLLKKIGENARKHVENYFTKDLMVKKTVSIYRDFFNSTNC